MLIDGRHILSLAKQRFIAHCKPDKKHSVEIINFRPTGNHVSVGHCAPYISSEISTREKARLISSVGLTANIHYIPDSTRVNEFIKLLVRLSGQTDVIGIIAQAPFPSHLLSSLSCIKKSLDIDNIGFHNTTDVSSATAETAFRVLSSLIKTGERVLIFGHGFIGKGIEKYLRANAFDYTCADIGFPIKETGNFDIVISCSGSLGIFNRDTTNNKKPRIIIDIGFSAEVTPNTGKISIYGDVSRALYNTDIIFSPVPGGMGPMELATILERIAKLQYEYNGNLWFGSDVIDSLCSLDQFLSSTTYNFYEFFHE